MKNENIEVSTAKFKCFWLIAAIIAIILAGTMLYDIGRPFFGLHSWGQAHFAWVARSHVKYGLSYTKGFDTFAVGNPPPQKQSRYLDHPPLYTLLDAATMKIFGINSWSLRVADVSMSVLTLLLFIIIVRRLTSDPLALIAGFLFAIFPIMGYFGITVWVYPFVFLAIWAYLTIIKAFTPIPTPKKYHYVILAASLFLSIQTGWEGFFFAMAIGIHYICFCIKRKTAPNWPLFFVLLIPPFLSVAFNFIILIGGHGWDYEKIIKLIGIRGGGGERGTHQWGPWFGRVWEFAILNFSLPVLTLAIGYLTLGHIYLWTSDTRKDPSIRLLKFPQFWFWLMPAIFQLFILKGTLWPHQYWERPLIPFIAIAGAQGILVLVNVIKKISPKLALSTAVIVLVVCIWFCANGTKYYYSVRWQQPEKLKMFEELREQLPTDAALLSFDPFIIDQFPGVKEPSYRPEVAWYLDRDVVPAQQYNDILKNAATGKYKFYLLPVPFKDKTTGQFVTMYNRDTSMYLLKVAGELQKKFPVHKVYPGKPGKRTPKGKFLEAAMPTYIVFKLK